jgi:hypothetical protein
MRRLLLVVALLVLAVPCLAFGQAQTVQPPKPGPEIQRIGYWVGTWKTESGPSSSTITWEWFAGGFGLIGREEGTGPAGKYSYLRIMTFDPDAKVYTHYMMTSRGPGGGLAKGTVTGNTWHWEWDAMVSGKPAKFRFTIVEVTPASFTGKIELSVAGGPWTVTEEVKGTKIK